MYARTLFNFLIVGLCLCAVGYPAQGQLVYRNFRNTTGLNLIGPGAAVVGGRLHLASPAPQNFGQVWSQEPFPVDTGFQAEFTFRYIHLGGILDANGHRGTDGISFYLQPISPTLELTHDIDKGLRIHFDAAQNRGTDDVSSSRIEVRLNGVRLGQTDVEAKGFRFREGAWFKARIVYDKASLTIYLNNRLATAYQGLPLSDVGPCYVGLHGYSGEAYADQEVMRFIFQSRALVGGNHLRRLSL